LLVILPLCSRRKSSNLASSSRDQDAFSLFFLAGLVVTARSSYSEFVGLFDEHVSICDEMKDKGK
jgi:hypothetical protein